MDGLSIETQAVVRALFKAEDRTEAERILAEECGNNLPLMQNSDAIQLERIRYAALKLSQGELDALRQAVQLAQTDWRDALVSAEFATNLTAHKDWAKQIVG